MTAVNRDCGIDLDAIRSRANGRKRVVTEPTANDDIHLLLAQIDDLTERSDAAQNFLRILLKLLDSAIKEGNEKAVVRRAALELRTMLAESP